MSENCARIFRQTRIVRECENATRIECMPSGGDSVIIRVNKSAFFLHMEGTHPLCMRST